MPKVLSYELSPNPATIFGCLLPAPWLGVAAGLLLAFGSAQGLPQRFAPLTLAITHVLSLGMLAPIMIGALFQLFPVVAGQRVLGATKIAPFVALLSALIAAALAVGFMQGSAHVFALAAGLATLLYGSVALALLATAWRVQIVDATTRSLCWSGLALGIVVALGVTLAGNFAGWWHSDILRMLDLHMAWGVLGWVLSLVVGVAMTTVPMFWQTLRPPPIYQRCWPAWLWLGLLLLPFEANWGWLYLCLGLVVWMGIFLHALWQAKRRFDPAWVLWLVSGFCWLSAASLLAASLRFELSSELSAALPWCLGVLSLVGGAVLPVNAMLGKIIPFLVFMHLRRQTPAGRRVPTMQAVLPPQYLRWQAYLLIAALLALLILPLAPHYLALPAGLLFAASQAMLAGLILRTLLRYRAELLNILLTPVINGN